MDRTFIEGALAVILGFVLFGGSVIVLLSAIFGARMGYLIGATGMFAFMIILSAIWAFGAPGTPPYLGPKGDLPSWVAVAAGDRLESPTYPVVERYPGGPWREPGPDLREEVEPVSLAFQEFLAEEATIEVEGQGIRGEVIAEQFEITDVRFTEADGTLLAAARGFARTGGPEVTVFGYEDAGDEPLPSFLFLGGSIIGFAAHLPFLNRAEQRRREILTGGDQQPWRGPA